MQLLKSKNHTPMTPPLDSNGQPIPSSRLMRFILGRLTEKEESLAECARRVIEKDRANVRKAILGEWSNGDVSRTIVERVYNYAIAHDVRWLNASELAAEIGVRVEVAERIILASRYKGKVLQTQQEPQLVLWDLTANKPVIGEQS
jgi:hypothetical protein